MDWLRGWSLTASALVVGSSLVVLGLLVAETLPVWRHSGVGYLLGTSWFYRAERFGILPMLYGTFAVSAVALTLAAPLALGAALCLAEVLPARLRLGAKVAFELLAAVPSVVYGLLGVLLLRNWIYRLAAPFEPLSGDTLATAGVLLAIMVLPTITTLADDALRGVPGSRRQAARALGLTRAEAAVGVVLPQALPGIAAAILLGLGRALGETIAVLLVVGRQDNQWPESLLSLQPLFAAGQTLTSKLGGSETHLAYGDPLHWGAMLGLAVLLLAVVLTLTVASRGLLERRRA